MHKDYKVPGHVSPNILEILIDSKWQQDRYWVILRSHDLLCAMVFSRCHFERREMFLCFHKVMVTRVEVLDDEKRFGNISRCNSTTFNECISYYQNFMKKQLGKKVFYFFYKMNPQLNENVPSTLAPLTTTTTTIIIITTTTTTAKTTKRLNYTVIESSLFVHLIQ